LAGQSRELWQPVQIDNVRRAQALYSQARDLDPRFAAARARLALMHTLAAATYDTTEARREQARLEAQAALRLSPGLPEAHEALASYWDLNHDVTRAIDELGLALDGFPHSADLHLALGTLLWRAGRIEEAVGEFEHVTRLEPSSPKGPFQAAVSYGRLRRREEALRAHNRAIAVAPDYHMVKVIKGHAYLRWTGIPDTLAAAMESVPADWDPDGMATFARFTALWVQRRYADGLMMLDRSRTELSRDGLVYQPIPLMRARLQESLGERNLARASYSTARSVLQDSVDAHPSDASIRVSLALSHAGLGRTAEAVQEARRAMELASPASQGRRGGTGRGPGGDHATAAMGGAVEVFAAAGEIDAALDLLELLFSMPAGREVTVPFLRVWPGFDPLRGDPRFDELLVRFAADQ
jgi:tetratricopeptide (TPR) repeat protein